MKARYRSHYRPSLRRVRGRMLPAALATAALAGGVPGVLGTAHAHAHGRPHRNAPPAAKQSRGGPATVIARVRDTETVPRGTTAT
jgi:hypothetical protein